LHYFSGASLASVAIRLRFADGKRRERFAKMRKIMSWRVVDMITRLEPIASVRFG
jgi:hypothetical protein